MTLLSLTPTFTQGLVLGQLSILLLLTFILRYLFFDTSPPPVLEDEPDSVEKERDLPQLRGALNAVPSGTLMHALDAPGGSRESLEWFNYLLANVSLRSPLLVCTN